MTAELTELSGANIVVYDTEIILPIDGKSITWDTHHRMGISVACAFDYRDGDWKVYLADNVWKLAHRLNRADLVVAFNQKGFDNKLIRASGFPLKPDDMLKNYDMLEVSRRATGWDESKRYPSGLKLDQHLQEMFGDACMKTAHGEEAPYMYQKGNLGELVNYCLADVRRERMLFEHIWQHGWVKTAAHGQREVVHPKEFLSVQQSQGSSEQSSLASSQSALLAGTASSLPPQVV